MVDWQKVAKNLRDLANNNTVELNDGQRASLKVVAEKLPTNGLIIADEVGMGKTRIATTVTKAVIEAGGRVAILVPPGLGPQWGDELRKSHVEGVPGILRSLDAYLYAWRDYTKDKPPKQREHTPWANYKALIISHAFCNWQVNSTTRKNWKWSLLPQTLALIRKNHGGEGARMPRGSKFTDTFNKKENGRVKAAAKWIAEKTNTQPVQELARSVQWGWASPLFEPENYRKHTEFRQGLERIVGLGLGEFDLVVIDEAHKSRGAESNLERLLTNVIVSSANVRRLAMTATPIELDIDQWQQILGRIGVTDDKANTAITKYAKAVQKVQQLPNDEQARKDFSDAATEFGAALRQYLLRRDKREVESVKAFAERTGSTHSDYRRLSEIAVQTKKIPPAWKQAVCAAEALSFVTRGLYGDDGKRLTRDEIEKAKRQRLTFGNGHGISTLMDESQRDKRKKENSNEEQEASLAGEEGSRKKVARIEWWNSLMYRAFQGNVAQLGESALYEHPAILAAVEAIEAVCSQGEKVLVFGRFTRPMQALVRLLNAREMLRCLASGRPWPQEVLRKDEYVDEETSVSVALQQLEIKKSLKQIKDELHLQYKQLEDARKEFREVLVKNIGIGLEKGQDNQRAKALLKIFSERAHEQIGKDKNNTQLVLMARAIHEVMAREDLDNPSSIALAFDSIITAASDMDEGDEDEDGDGELDSTEAGELWGTLTERLKEEYDRPEGGFARLMNGNTKPPTRRLLQLAFNREHSHPKVLVAQSVVGREGLNLHEACRTVILLHAEWNPGIVEQQIGRVDRINSLWEKKLKAALSDTTADALPRIEIRPVIFQGTYDEHNWKVLMQRWDDLRAQLHGVVITPSIAESLPAEVVKSINASAPKFSPYTTL